LRCKPIIWLRHLHVWINRPPEGVAIEHRSVLALTAWASSTFSREELNGVLAGTSVCFDLSIFEILVPLALGGRVILADNVLQLSQLPRAMKFI